MEFPRSHDQPPLFHASYLSYHLLPKTKKAAAFSRGLVIRPAVPDRRSMALSSSGR
jgi:hypothetical protein